MSLTASEMTPADIRACTAGNDGGSGGFGGFGGEGLISLIVLFLFASMFGFGGMGGMGMGMGGGILPWLLFGGGGFGGRGSCATQADLAAGFNNSAVLSGINDLRLGQAGVQQTLCQGFNGVNTAILQTANGIDNAVCTLGYNIQSGMNGISREIGDCCCKTQRAIDGVRYDMATQACETRNTIQNTTRDVIDNQNANARAILDALTAQRIADKDAKIAEQTQTIFGLQLAASQAKQNQYLISQLRDPCPIPAYMVPNPNCCYSPCGN